MKRRTLLILLVAVIVLGGAGVGSYFLWFSGEDAPPPAELSGTGEQASDAGSGDGATDPVGIDGTWQVVEGDAANPTFVGYRVTETLLGVNRARDAVGRTSDVEGTVTIAGTTVETAEFTADMTTMRSSSNRRDSVLRRRGIETEDFPEATFQLTQPIEFGPLPAPGQATNVTATGELTLHGVTNAVSIPLEAVIVEGETTRIEIVGSVEISMADYEIEPPNVVGVVSVEDHGTLELHVFLERAG